MFRGLLVLAAVGLLVYALTDCLTSEEKRPAGAPRALWILAIVLLPVLGPVLWLVLSRKQDAEALPPRTDRAPRRSGPVAPDDDPEFLRRLDQERRRREQQGHGADGDADPQR